MSKLGVDKIYKIIKVTGSTCYQKLPAYAYFTRDEETWLQLGFFLGIMKSGQIVRWDRRGWYTKRDV